jgi:hypothetical protein
LIDNTRRLGKGGKEVGLWQASPVRRIRYPELTHVEIEDLRQSVGQ